MNPGSIIFLLIGICNSSLCAVSINISKHKELSILKKSDVYLDEKQLSIHEILEKNLFKPYNKPYINIGASRKTIWIKFRLQNPTQKPIERSLILTSSLLEYIALYKDTDINKPIIKGVSYISKKHTTLFPFYNIQMEAKTSQDYYLEVKSLYEPIDFGVITPPINNLNYGIITVWKR